MRRRRAYLPWFVMLASMGILLAGCARRQVKVDPPPPPPAREDAPKSSRLEFEGYSFIFPPERQPRVWEIKTRRGSGSTEDSTLTLEGVECTLYHDGKPALRVTARTGVAAVEGDTARLSLAGGVKAADLSRHLVLRAEQFTWTSSENRIHASSVRFLGDGLEHAADYAVFSMDLTEGAFRGHVTTKSAPAGQ